jgi:hypothetical protein
VTFRLSNQKLLLAAAVLLAASLFLPLWSAHMESPQYRDEEALEVRVYPGRIEGDLAEIETLNQYVGVALPLDTPELRASPWILGGLLLAVLLALLLPRRARTWAALVLAVAAVGVAALGGVRLQYRLYEMGHSRGESILEGVPDFTPPLLGTARIANFTARMSLGAGALAYGLSAALLLLAFFAGRRSEERSQIPSSENAASKLAASRG